MNYTITLINIITFSEAATTARYVSKENSIGNDNVNDGINIIAEALKVAYEPGSPCFNNAPENNSPKNSKISPFKENDQNNGNVAGYVNQSNSPTSDLRGLSFSPLNSANKKHKTAESSSKTQNDSNSMSPKLKALLLCTKAASEIKKSSANSMKSPEEFGISDRGSKSTPSYKKKHVRALNFGTPLKCKRIQKPKQARASLNFSNTSRNNSKALNESNKKKKNKLTTPTSLEKIVEEENEDIDSSVKDMPSLINTSDADFNDTDSLVLRLEDNENPEDSETIGLTKPCSKEKSNDNYDLLEIPDKDIISDEPNMACEYPETPLKEEDYNSMLNISISSSVKKFCLEPMTPYPILSSQTKDQTILEDPDLNTPVVTASSLTTSSSKTPLIKSYPSGPYSNSSTATSYYHPSDLSMTDSESSSPKYLSENNDPQLNIDKTQNPTSSKKNQTSPNSKMSNKEMGVAIENEIEMLFPKLVKDKTSDNSNIPTEKNMTSDLSPKAMDLPNNVAVAEFVQPVVSENSISNLENKISPTSEPTVNTDKTNIILDAVSPSNDILDEKEKVTEDKNVTKEKDSSCIKDKKLMSSKSIMSAVVRLNRIPFNKNETKKGKNPPTKRTKKVESSSPKKDKWESKKVSPQNKNNKNPETEKHIESLFGSDFEFSDEDLKNTPAKTDTKSKNNIKTNSSIKKNTKISPTTGTSICTRSKTKTGSPVINEVVIEAIVSNRKTSSKNNDTEKLNNEINKVKLDISSKFGTPEKKSIKSPTSPTKQTTDISKSNIKASSSKKKTSKVPKKSVAKPKSKAQNRKISPNDKSPNNKDNDTKTPNLSKITKNKKNKLKSSSTSSGNSSLSTTNAKVSLPLRNKKNYKKVVNKNKIDSPESQDENMEKIGEKETSKSHILENSTEEESSEEQNIKNSVLPSENQKPDVREILMSEFSDDKDTQTEDDPLIPVLNEVSKQSMFSNWGISQDRTPTHSFKNRKVTTPSTSEDIKSRWSTVLSSDVNITDTEDESMAEKLKKSYTKEKDDVKLKKRVVLKDYSISTGCARTINFLQSPYNFKRLCSPHANYNHIYKDSHDVCNVTPKHRKRLAPDTPTTGIFRSIFVNNF